MPTYQSLCFLLHNPIPNLTSSCFLLWKQLTLVLCWYLSWVPALFVGMPAWKWSFSSCVIAKVFLCVVIQIVSGVRMSSRNFYVTILLTSHFDSYYLTSCIITRNNSLLIASLTTGEKKNFSSILLSSVTEACKLNNNNKKQINRRKVQFVCIKRVSQK